MVPPREPTQSAKKSRHVRSWKCQISVGELYRWILAKLSDKDIKKALHKYRDLMPRQSDWNRKLTQATSMPELGFRYLFRCGQIDESNHRTMQKMLKYIDRQDVLPYFETILYNTNNANCSLKELQKTLLDKVCVFLELSSNLSESEVHADPPYEVHHCQPLDLSRVTRSTLKRKSDPPTSHCCTFAKRIRTGSSGSPRRAAPEEQTPCHPLGICDRAHSAIIANALTGPVVETLMCASFLSMLNTVRSNLRVLADPNLFCKVSPDRTLWDVFLSSPNNILSSNGIWAALSHLFFASNIKPYLPNIPIPLPRLPPGDRADPGQPTPPPDFAVINMILEDDLRISSPHREFGGISRFDPMPNDNPDVNPAERFLAVPVVGRVLPDSNTPPVAAPLQLKQVALSAGGVGVTAARHDSLIKFYCNLKLRVVINTGCRLESPPIVSLDADDLLDQQINRFAQASTLFLSHPPMTEFICHLRFTELSQLETFWRDYQSGLLREFLLDVLKAPLSRSFVGQPEGYPYADVMRRQIQVIPMQPVPNQADPANRNRPADQPAPQNPPPAPPQNPPHPPNQPGPSNPPPFPNAPDHLNSPPTNQPSTSNPPPQNLPSTSNPPSPKQSGSSNQPASSNTQDPVLPSNPHTNQSNHSPNQSSFRKQLPSQPGQSNSPPEKPGPSNPPDSPTLPTLSNLPPPSPPSFPNLPPRPLSHSVPSNRPGPSCQHGPVGQARADGERPGPSGQVSPARQSDFSDRVLLGTESGSSIQASVANQCDPSLQAGPSNSLSSVAGDRYSFPPTKDDVSGACIQVESADEPDLVDQSGTQDSASSYQVSFANPSADSQLLHSDDHPHTGAHYDSMPSSSIASHSVPPSEQGGTSGQVGHADQRNVVDPPNQVAPVSQAAVDLPDNQIPPVAPAAPVDAVIQAAQDPVNPVDRAVLVDVDNQINLAYQALPVHHAAFVDEVVEPAPAPPLVHDHPEFPRNREEELRFPLHPLGHGNMPQPFIRAPPVYHEAFAGQAAPGIAVNPAPPGHPMFPVQPAHIGNPVGPFNPRAHVGHPFAPQPVMNPDMLRQAMVDYQVEQLEHVHRLFENEDRHHAHHHHPDDGDFDDPGFDEDPPVFVNPANPGIPANPVNIPRLVAPGLRIENPGIQPPRLVYVDGIWHPPPLVRLPNFKHSQDLSPMQLLGDAFRQLRIQQSDPGTLPPVFDVHVYISRREYENCRSLIVRNLRAIPSLCRLIAASNYLPETTRGRNQSGSSKPSS